MLTAILAKKQKRKDRGAVQKLPGHSGFAVYRTGTDQVEKRSGGGDASRLERQWQKQSTFEIRHPRFRVCEVLSSRREGTEFVFFMPFHPAETIVQFVDRATPAEIDQFVADLFELIEEFLARSVIGELRPDFILAKSQQTAKRLQPHKIGDDFSELMRYHEAHILSFASGFSLPMGPCHGDLNFSNLLFDRGRHCYILLDFLDCYFDSPIHDLIKVKQETTLRWSSFHYGISGFHHDQAKYALVMDYIDGKLHGLFDSRPFFRDYVEVFEFQNLLRLLPYANDTTIIQAIFKRMEALKQLRHQGNYTRKGG